tara:strand:- start:48 stop:278 length:231 start_codon:yes stop_codon:yes gene_type:complete
MKGDDESFSLFSTPSFPFSSLSELVAVRAVAVLAEAETLPAEEFGELFSAPLFSLLTAAVIAFVDDGVLVGSSLTR